MSNPIVSPNAESDNLKQCTRCGEWKPATPDHFWRDKKKVVGLRSECISCACKRMGRSFPQRPKRVAVKKPRGNGCRPEIECPEVKQCVDCGQVKPFTLEYFAPGRNRFGMSPHCRPCAKLKNRQRRLSRYHEYREYNRQWKDAHPEAVRRHRRTSNNNRRVREHKSAGRFTTKDVRRQLEWQKCRCWWCGKKIKDDKYHIDHRIPLSRGGSNEPENIVIACVECNLSKNDKLPHEWIGRLL